MVEASWTGTTLLSPVKDERADDASRELVQLYGPVVYAFARKQGLGDAEAADLMQEVLRGVTGNAETMDYQPQSGSFHGWLFTVTRNKVKHFLSSKTNRRSPTADSGFQASSFPDQESGPDSDWDLEYQRQLAATAMGRMKHVFRFAILQAFWKTAVDGRPARDVGLELKMTPGAVYVAKCRVLTRLREEVQRLQAKAESW